MIIYIRHANDNERDPQYKQDSNITKRGIKNTKKFVHRMVKKYGFPKTILFSPFQRCTQTVAIMVSELISLQSSKTVSYNIKKDLTLSRVFTSTDKENVSVSPETMRLNINIHESSEDIDRRVKQHLRNTLSYDTPIWCITHAIIYKRISRQLNIPTPDHIEFLDHFIHQKYKIIARHGKNNKALSPGPSK